MSASNPQGKKMIKTGNALRDKTQATFKSASSAPQPLLYGKKHYLLMGLGILLLAIGLILMAGGEMPSPDVWDESLIYSTRRTVLAPIVMLSGIAVEIYAIFKR